LNSFAPISDVPVTEFNNLVKYISNWTYSMLLVALSFKIQLYPGTTFMLYISGLTLFVLLLISIYAANKNTNELKIYPIGFIRPVIFLAIALILILTPKEDLIKYKIINKIEVSENKK
jgi:hypothetical protein